MSTGVVIAALVAGALGAALRYGVTILFARRPRRLPVAVLVVNTVGCLVAGVVLAAAARDGAADLRYILLGGFAGGLTTFSTFGVETVQLALEGRWRIAVASAAANVVAGIGAAVAAFAVTSALLG